MLSWGEGSTSSRADVADKRRACIIRAALACFARKGYHLTTMDDIAQESGLSKGSLYWYFKSKKELFRVIIEAYFHQMETAIQPILEGTLSPGEKLRTIAQVMLDSVTKAQSPADVMVDLWSQARHEEDLHQFLHQAYEPYYRNLAALIETGIQQGEFRSVNAVHLASLLVAVTNGLMMQGLVMPDWVDRTGQIESWLDTLLDGLRPISRLSPPEFSST